MIDSDSSECGDLAIPLPVLRLCVCVRTEGSLFSDTQRKEARCPRTTYRGQLSSPPPKPVPLTIILLSTKQNLTL